MSIYFSEPQKKQRWESGQAILHRETGSSKKTRNRQEASAPRETKGQEINAPKETEHRETIKNSYGKLNYLHLKKKQGQTQQGFSLEALEAPGTPLHTEKEKQLSPATMKKIRQDGRQTLFASEVPLRSQALFYDLSDSKKSVRFLTYMKHLLKTQGHQTLQDAFGFLDQESERQELEVLKNSSQELSLQEFAQKNQRMDTLHSRLLQKQSRERQLCKDLQLLLDQRAEEERAAFGHSRKNSAETTPKDREEKRPDSLQRKPFYSPREDITAPGEDIAAPAEDTDPSAPESPPEEQNKQAKQKSN
ncbi:MAG: hypothetical protein HFH49_11295 [Lachnospiraceae bacterium]|nr:hypothetical protein [Lachnospiraceae bacterium]